MTFFADRRTCLPKFHAGWPWLTGCILHGNHERLVFQEVLVVLNDVGVVEQLQHLTLVLSGQALVAGHLLHRDLLQDDQSAVAAPPTQVDDPEGWQSWLVLKKNI